MRRFEQLHAEEQLDIVLELLRLCADGRTFSIAKLAADNDITPFELWADVVATVGHDALPWAGYPLKPKPEVFLNAPGAQQPPPEWLERLWEKIEPLTRGQLH